MIPFGPRLIGQTEKALSRVLQRIPEHHDLAEPEWVTLRLAQDRRPAGSLADFVAGESHYPYAMGIVAGLHTRGLLREDALTEEGRLLVARVTAAVDHQVGHLWAAIPDDQATNAALALNHLLSGCRQLVADDVQPTPATRRIRTTREAAGETLPDA